MRKRRRVENHIGTIHAIAMANLCEIAAGTLAEVTTPASMRWIPRQMMIRYLGRANGRIVARASMPPVTAFEAQDVIVPVEVHDQTQALVVHADITMYLSPRPTRSIPSTTN
jgi:acyl-coenzyme A thioesterase PaaI-like protein